VSEYLLHLFVGFDVSVGQFFGNLSAFQGKTCDRPPVLLSPMRKIPRSQVTLTVRWPAETSGTTEPIKGYANDVNRLTNRPTFHYKEGRKRVKNDGQRVTRLHCLSRSVSSSATSWHCKENHMTNLRSAQSHCDKRLVGQ
jgi:hypothetical protein